MIVKKIKHKKYNRFGMKCYKDPVRNILIKATQEEEVRQDVVCLLTGSYLYSKLLLSTEYRIPGAR